MSDRTLRPPKMSPTVQPGVPYSGQGMSQGPYGPGAAGTTGPSPEATEAAKAMYATQTSPQRLQHPDRTSSASAAAAAATMAMASGGVSPTGGGRPGHGHMGSMADYGGPYDAGYGARPDQDPYAAQQQHYGGPQQRNTTRQTTLTSNTNSSSPCSSNSSSSSSRSGPSPHKCSNQCINSSNRRSNKSI